ncbi:MAG: hypothetical protein KDK78_07805 [Chlamydiia bacterium]|nr:hypothetical protein [Chlamydiia bacterium]
MIEKGAEESEHIKRARDKLRAQMQEEEMQITPQALDDVCRKIYHWIQRHSSERENLKDKNIALFDENRHSAVIRSRRVGVLRTQLFHELNAEKMRQLRGRVHVHARKP